MGSGSVHDRPSVLSMTSSTPTGHVHPYFGCKFQYLRTFGTSIRVLLVPVLELLQWAHVELECKARIVLFVKKLGEASSSNAPLVLKHNKVLSHFPAPTSSFPLWLLGINHSTQYRSHRSRASDHLSVRTLFPLSGNKNETIAGLSVQQIHRPTSNMIQCSVGWFTCTIALGGRNCHEFPAQFCKVQFSKMFRFSKSTLFCAVPCSIYLEWLGGHVRSSLGVSRTIGPLYGGSPTDPIFHYTSHHHHCYWTFRIQAALLWILVKNRVLGVRSRLQTESILTPKFKLKAA